MTFCDLAEIYGVGDLSRLIIKRYDLVFSLWLNRTRSQVRRAESVRLGAATALGGDMQLGWFLCVTDTEDEGRFMFDRYQMEKVKQAQSVR
ncbi:MAG: hypothetical protein ACO23H_03240 [Alphaproteobacteria bacterium]